MRRLLPSILGVALAVTLVACGAALQATFSADLTSEAAVPAPTLNGATPSGSAEATLDEGASTLTVTGDFSGLTGPATAAHIHGPAPEGEAAGVVFPLNVDAAASGSVSGTWDGMTAEEIEQLRDGLYYVNVHTEANPAGEIRGQLQ